MRPALAATCIIVLFNTPVRAGPNSNGAIIVHTNDSYTYGSLTKCTTSYGQPANCASAITRTDKSVGSVVWFLAAFPSVSSPSVRTVYFGVNFDEANLDPSSLLGPCGPAGTVEIPDAGWPANNAGNSVGFGSPVAGNNLFRFYYFQVNDSAGGIPGPYFCSAINPTGGYAAFFDDQSPPNQDNIERFGCVRWSAEGSNTCPPTLEGGACCNPATGVCMISTEADCVPPAVWHAEWLACSPNPCPQPLAACCAIDGGCTLSVPEGCLPPSTWHSDWLVCSPNPCSPAAACCDPATGACNVITESHCLAPRVWHGDWPACDPNPCPQPLAACCTPAGDCTLTVPADCPAPSVWHPEWATCAPDPCTSILPGACCNPATSLCTIVVEAQCHVPSVWHAEWTSCSPNPCPTSTTGPNVDGAIIVHTNDSYAYLSTTVCTTPLGQPASCEEAITQTDKSVGVVVWFLAAFPPYASPAVASVYFGFDYDDANLDPSERFGPCGPPGTIEAPDAGWPQNVAGNAVGFGTPVLGNTLFRFYYFKVSDYLGQPGPYLCSAINPTGGYAAFFDDSFPPGQNNVTRFGCINWYGDGGMNECPQVQPVLGACCDVLGNCTMTTQADCLASNAWLPEPTCEPNPCPVPIPTERSSWGKVKALFR